MPTKVIAGKPTAIIFRDGADRVMMPSPVLTRSIAIIMGKAMRSPPVKMVEDQSITDCTNGSNEIEAPKGKLSKLMKSSSINIKWPSIKRKIRVDSMISNCEIVGTFPKVGSTIFAILKPIELEMA